MIRAAARFAKKRTIGAILADASYLPEKQCFAWNIVSQTQLAQRFPYQYDKRNKRSVRSDFVRIGTGGALCVFLF
ncbi:hypothetical protein HMPREF7215_1968 [Pyramidobacter piscolens W5455]|uniref:Transposase IS701-like DDE domain-containing protein n=1 Tax=Pyramidobacter piscolens W5455 TaxID=352165 RepID=A0ABM9ZVT0_9BACT|nr:hypothetical protein HMPREF7215_1968 [Pyramidobacter piscolens W5455]